MGVLHRNVSDADILIKALADFRDDVGLLIIGEGPDRESLEKLAKEEGVSTHFAGYVAPQKVPEYIKTADIAVIPFRDTLLNRCKCSVRLYEFMAMEKPIIASRVGENTNVLREGRNALLFNPSDLENLKEKMRMALTSSALGKKLAKQARKDVLRYYTWDKLGNDLIKIFNRV